MKKINAASCAIFFSVFSQQAWADRCDYEPNSGPVNKTVPLSVANISVGADVPVGTTVHTLRVVGSAGLQPWLTCRTEGASTKFAVDQYLNLSGTLTPDTGWTGVYAGAIYKTNIAGLSFAIVNNDGITNGKAITTTPTQKWTTPIGPGAYKFYYGNSFTIHFIKTGPMSSGSFNGASLPAVLLTTRSVTPVTGIPDTPYHINFSGTLNVIAATCVTPDVTVDMNKWDVSNWFNNGSKGTSTWRNFNLQLTGCPVFHGNYSDASSPPTYNTGDGFVAGKLVGNSLTVKFTPTYGAFDAANGIMKLDNSANSATGVGIQIASGTTSPTPINFNNTLNFPLTNNMGSTINLPFSARYIQTATRATPGKANSKMMFTINYY